MWNISIHEILIPDVFKLTILRNLITLKKVINSSEHKIIFKMNYHDLKEITSDLSEKANYWSFISPNINLLINFFIGLSIHVL